MPIGFDLAEAGLIFFLMYLLFKKTPQPKAETSTFGPLGICSTKRFLYKGGATREFHNHPRCRSFSGDVLPFDGTRFHGLDPLQVTQGSHLVD